MKSKLKIASFLALSIATISAVSAAEISVGTISGPETELVQVAKKVAKEKYDLDVKIVEFNDYVTPNVALADGSLGANAFQHQPYLDKMIKDRGFKLKSVGYTFVYPIGAYSKKIKKIEDLKDGSTIAVPNDPTNEARALLLLAKQGLIELRDPKSLDASIIDISKNPHNYKFKEIEAPQLPRVLGEVDVAFINSTFAVPAGLTPTKDSILLEDSDSPYTNVIAVREGDENKKEVQDFVKSFQSDEVKEKAKEVFKGGAVAGW